MQPGALAPYERSLDSGAGLQLCREDGRVRNLDVARWLAPADQVDRRALARCLSPVLDAGCGPGRILAALGEQGHFAVGVDIAARAVQMSRARGHNVLHRDLFAPMPGTGRWGTIVLIDGNVGIGGDVESLLTRVHALLAPGGRAVVETDPDPSTDEGGEVRFAVDGQAVGPWFRWGFVGVDRLRRAALATGFAVHEVRHDEGRTFVELVAHDASGGCRP